MRIEKTEKIIETYIHKGAVIELVERPETIYAGKILMADSLGDTPDFGGRITESESEDFSRVTGKVQPELDVHISINFWRIGKALHGFVFGREVTSENQPADVDVFKMPASRFLRVYSDRAAAGLIGKEACEPWELFAYFRAKLMPKHGFVMAENGAQEIEIYEPGNHESGYAYVPVERKRRRPLFVFKRKSAPGHGAA